MSYNTRKLYTVDGDEIQVKVQIPYCKTCGKLTQTELDDYDAYSHFNKNTIVKSNKSKELDNIFLRNLAKYHRIFNNIHISHETVRNSLILTDKLNQLTF